MISTAERRLFTWKLRLSGATFEDIADAVIKHFGEDKLPKGYDSRYAYKDVKRELDRMNAERRDSTEQYQRTELERLDKMLSSIWGQVLKGHLGAIDRALGIGAHRARLLGLDAPTKVYNENSGEVTICVVYGDDGRKDAGDA